MKECLSDSHFGMRLLPSQKLKLYGSRKHPSPTTEGIGNSVGVGERGWVKDPGNSRGEGVE